jgi:hypothetical protein
MTTESQRDVIRNLDQLEEAMQYDLSPKGALEGIFAAEITRAASRLRRCATVEHELTQQDEPVTATPQSTPGLSRVDRTRAEAHRILRRSMDELRRLQNERRFRIEVLDDDFDTTNLGLASYKDLMPAMAAEKRWQMNKRKLEGLGDFENILATATGAPSASPPAQITERSQSVPAGTPRNAPCPCGSGQKHKRCCGKDAAPVLCENPYNKAA